MLRNRIKHVQHLSSQGLVDAMAADLCVACDAPGCRAEAPATIGVAEDPWAVAAARRKAVDAGWFVDRWPASPKTAVTNFCPEHKP